MNSLQEIETYLRQAGWQIDARANEIDKFHGQSWIDPLFKASKLSLTEAFKAQRERDKANAGGQYESLEAF